MSRAFAILIACAAAGCGTRAESPVDPGSDSGVPPPDAGFPVVQPPLPDGGAAEVVPLSSSMLWSVLLLPAGSTDLDDGDVMTFSFYRTDAGYDVRTCATDFDSSAGAAAYYTIDCTGAGEATATATVDDRTLTLTFSEVSGGGTMTLTFDDGAQSLTGTFEHSGGSGTVLESRRIY